MNTANPAAAPAPLTASATGHQRPSLIGTTNLHLYWAQEGMKDGRAYVQQVAACHPKEAFQSFNNVTAWQNEARRASIGRTDLTPDVVLSDRIYEAAFMAAAATEAARILGVLALPSPGPPMRPSEIMTPRLPVLAGRTPVGTVAARPGLKTSHGTITRVHATGFWSDRPSPRPCKGWLLPEAFVREEDAAENPDYRKSDLFVLILTTLAGSRDMSTSTSPRIRVIRETYYVGSIVPRVGLKTNVGTITRLGKGVFWTDKESLYVHSGWLYTEGCVAWEEAVQDAGFTRRGLYEPERLALHAKEVDALGMREVCRRMGIKVAFGRDLLAAHTALSA